MAVSPPTVFERSRIMHCVMIFMMILVISESSKADITYVHRAVAQGAVCLDGSPPAYELSTGFGLGIDNWVLYIEGGAWCVNANDCSSRSQLSLGSSKYMTKTNFTGILSNDSQYNPVFYNWNRVFLRYCDGGSFTADIEAIDHVNKLYYRGARVFKAIIEDLNIKGLNHSKNVILSGRSAGGLAAIFHCDDFAHPLLTRGTRVKCVADGGFFIDVKDISGASTIKDLFNRVVTIHGSVKTLPQSCTSKMKPSLCFFPQNVARGIQTPLFIINSVYDTWQVDNVWIPNSTDPYGLWINCKKNYTECTTDQIQILQGFRSEFINALNGLGYSTTRGYFIDSCRMHTQAYYQNFWFGITSPRLNNKRMAEAVGEWFYDKSPFKAIDKPYPYGWPC